MERRSSWSIIAIVEGLAYTPETRLPIPLAPAYTAIAVWLIVSGVTERDNARIGKLTIAS